jgi:thiol:disulfide interchange protein DsbD
MLKKLFFILFAIFISCCAVAHAAQPASQADNGFTAAPAEPNLLTPDQAFNFRLLEQSPEALSIRFLVAPGYYLYKERISFKLDNKPLSDVQFPAGEIKQDAAFGKMEVFHHDFTVRVSLAGQSSAAGVLQLSYQGCSEQGVCYAPISKSVSLGKQTTAPQDNYSVQLLASGQWWLIISGFFGLGLLLSLTPCVLPMIPILSGIIVGDKKLHHHATSRLHAFNLSLAYTLGMALSYTAAGVAAAYSGQLISSSLQSPLVLSLTALLLAALALSTFGWYEIKLPDALQHKLVSTANRFKGGQLISVFFMGVISSLIVSPCVAAPLAGALLYISQTHHVLTGAVALFSLSIGMGVPLLIIGASAKHVLPKAGPWMNLVKYLFGMMMLAVAILLLSPILASPLELALWAVLVAIPAVYLFRLSVARGLMRWLKYFASFLLAGVSLIYLLAALTGGHSLLNPLQHLYAGKSPEQQVQWIKVTSLDQLHQTIAQHPDKLVMLDFYADWCVSCKEMEKYTFSDSKVAKQLQQLLLIQADVTDNTAAQVKLLQHFKLFGPPAVIFLNSKAQEIANSRIIGFENAAIFAQHVDKVIKTGESECQISVSC